jgi:autotransporter-associated beta strand protein
VIQYPSSGLFLMDGHYLNVIPSTLNLGIGADAATIARTLDYVLTINGGAGADSVTQSGQNSSGYLIFNGGSGDDTLTISFRPNPVGFPSVFNGGTGQNTLNMASKTGGTYIFKTTAADPSWTQRLTVNVSVPPPPPEETDPPVSGTSIVEFDQGYDLKGIDILDPSSKVVFGLMGSAAFSSSTGSLTGMGEVDLINASLLTVGGGNQDTSYSGVVSGSGALIKAGAGTLTLSGINSYSGGTAINGGILSVLADNNLGAGAGAVGIGNGTLLSTGTFSTGRAVSFNNANSAIDVTGTNALTLTGALAGSGGLTKGAGAGTLILAPAVPASIALASLTVNAGGVNIGTAAVGATSALNVSGAVNINGTAILRLVSTPQTSAGTSGSTPRLTNNFGSLNIATTVQNNAAYGPNTPVPTATLDIGGHNVLLPRGNLAISDPGSVLQKSWQDIVWGFNSGGSPNGVLSGAAGNWNGAGIISSLARADVALPAAQRYGLAIGVWDSTDVGVATGQVSGKVLIGATVLGDANGDGLPDITDLAIVQNNAGSGDHWAQGDFNYDQFVGIDDLAILQGNAGNSLNF